MLAQTYLKTYIVARESEKETADLSTTLRSGRDDNFV
jgi:hypothetical protein